MKVFLNYNFYVEKLERVSDPISGTERWRTLITWWRHRVVEPHLRCRARGSRTWISTSFPLFSLIHLVGCFGSSIDSLTPPRSLFEPNRNSDRILKSVNTSSPSASILFFGSTVFVFPMCAWKSREKIGHRLYGGESGTMG